MPVRDELRLFAAAACLIALPSNAQDTNAGVRLEYRTVPVSATRVDRDDPRFRLAAAGFPFRGGLRLTSRDRTIYSIAWMGGYNTGMLRDGRAIVFWPGPRDDQPVAEARIARTAELAGSERGHIGGTAQASSHPELPGYRYVMSERVVGTRDYLGLWRRTRGSDETLVVNFLPASDRDQAAHRIVGRLPLRLTSLYIYQSFHDVSWELTLASEATVGRPIYILNYSWQPSYYQPLPTSDHGNAASR